MPARLLIVNADDFGLSEGVNRGIITAHEQGIVTSASLMVRGAAAGPAAAYARRRPQLDLGLHVDLGEWRYAQGEWIAVYHVVPLDHYEDVALELERQLDAFRSLVGRNPTHIDSHQHVNAREPARSVFAAAAVALATPVRHAPASIRYCGEFYGQTDSGEPLRGRIDVPALVSILSRLPEGVTELACHPGLDPALDTMYRDERAREVQTLCDPEVRAALTSFGIELSRFSMLARSGEGMAVGIGRS